MIESRLAPSFMKSAADSLAADITEKTAEGIALLVLIRWLIPMDTDPHPSAHNVYYVNSRKQ